MKAKDAGRQVNFQLWTFIENQSAPFFPCLLFLLFLDVLANPYAGLVHDARLYAVQALTHLYPGRYAKDLFFLYGSQDSFSLFSFIYARSISLLGLHYGSWLLYVASRAVLYAGALRFFRRLLASEIWAFIAVCMIAAGPVKYIFFEINEPFLTPRLAAVGLSMLGLALAYDNRNIPGLFLLLAAGALHPLMALGPGLVLVAHWLYKRQWVILAGLAFGFVSALAALMLARPQAMTSLLHVARFDPDWLEILRARSTYLFPETWTWDQWLRIGSGIGLALLGLRYFDRRQKEFVVLVASVAVFGILFTVVDIAGPRWALPFQLQPWRAYWMLQILTPALACFLCRALWHGGPFFHKLAGMLIAIPFLLAGSASVDTIVWLIPAALLMLIPLFDGLAISPKLQKLLLFATAILLFLQPLPLLVEKLTAIGDSNTVWRAPFLAVAALGAFFRPFAVAAAALFIPFARRNRASISILFLLFPLLTVNSRTHFVYPEIGTRERGFSKPKGQALAAFADWRKTIPSASVVLADNSMPIEAIWFDLRASSYYSEMQGPGILFSRELAFEYEKRQQIVSQFFNGDWGNDALSWCREKGIDFVISRKVLPLPHIGRREGIHLYSITNAAASRLSVSK